MADTAHDDDTETGMMIVASTACDTCMPQRAFSRHDRSMKITVDLSKAARAESCLAGGLASG